MCPATKTQDAGGCTPLHWAARGGHTPVFELLIRLGADTSVHNADGADARGVAEAAGKTEVATLIETLPRKIKKEKENRRKKEQKRRREREKQQQAAAVASGGSDGVPIESSAAAEPEPEPEPQLQPPSQPLKQPAEADQAAVTDFVLKVSNCVRLQRPVSPVINPPSSSPDNNYDHMGWISCCIRWPQKSSNLVRSIAGAQRAGTTATMPMISQLHSLGSSFSRETAGFSHLRCGMDRGSRSCSCVLVLIADR